MKRTDASAQAGEVEKADAGMRRDAAKGTQADAGKNISSLHILEMQPQDVAEVAQLEKEIFSVPWSERGFLSSLQSQDTVYLVVRENDRLIGYCGFLQSFDEADITNVAVRPDARARGVGHKMLEELMHRGRERGIMRYTLEVRVSNAAAIRLYHKLGFEDCGIRKNFYEKPCEDALIMWTKQDAADILSDSQ